MSKLALGTVQFGVDYGIANQSGQVMINEVRSILNFAKDNGINTLDTASSYGNSEQILGEIGVNGYQVITKTIPLKSNVNQVIVGFYQSLKNLDQDKVKGLLIHNNNDIKKKQFDALFGNIVKLKQEGLVEKIGFSAYMPEQIDFLLQNFDFDLIQLPFNIFDGRLIKGGQLQALKSKGIEVHARSIFLQGLLLMPEQDRPENFKRWNALWNIWGEWLNDNQVTALEASIRYAISFPEISKVLVGVDTLDQLKEIIASSSGELPCIPESLYTDDPDLLNPSNWRKL